MASERSADEVVATFIAAEPRFEWFSTRERIGTDVATERGTLAAYLDDRKRRGIVQRLEELTFNGIDGDHANVSFAIIETAGEATVTYPGKAAIDCETEKIMVWSEGGPSSASATNPGSAPPVTAGG